MTTPRALAEIADFVGVGAGALSVTQEHSGCYTFRFRHGRTQFTISEGEAIGLAEAILARTHARVVNVSPLDPSDAPESVWVDEGDTPTANH